MRFLIDARTNGPALCAVFQTVSDAAKGWWRGDADRLRQIVGKLLSNAVKFSPPDAPVRVAAATAGAQVTVRVTDRGRGIAPGARAHVFEPFFRGRGAESGSGLGLTICRGFVEANGGRIRLQTGRGDGTSFSVSFPRVKQPATPG